MKSKIDIWPHIEFIQGSINLFITICDYDEEKKYDDENDEKDTRPNF